jgi:transcriptional regulator with XRE-family HTH domain
MRSRARPGPGILDIFVGRRVRARRMAVGMSIEELAEQAELSFQQIQKYESGVNRMSAGRLAQFAVILRTSPEAFFTGAEALHGVLVHGPEREAADTDFVKHVSDLLIAYVDANPAAERAQILEIVRSNGRLQVKERPRAVFVSASAIGRELAAFKLELARRLSANRRRWLQTAG